LLALTLGDYLLEDFLLYFSRRSRVALKLHEWGQKLQEKAPTDSVVKANGGKDGSAPFAWRLGKR